MADFAASQNFVVTGIMFGGYPRGSVLPKHSFANSIGIDHLVAEGIVAPSDAAVNVALAEPVRESDLSTVALFDAHTDLSDKHEKLKTEAAFDRTRADEAERKVKSIEKEWATQITELDRLKAVISEQAKLLDAATNPDESTKKTKGK